MRFRQPLSRRRFVASLAIGGLAVVGALYRAPQPSGDVMAQEAAPEPAAPTAPPGPATKRGLAVVTALTPEPASFSVRREDGEVVTYRVLDTTVFTGGADRPYNFGLLKVGDNVRVKGGLPGRKAERTGQVDVQPVARRVVVRVAGERRPGGPARNVSQPDAGRKGVSDGVL